MAKTATIEIEGKKYEFPLVLGTENEVAIDISKLRAVTGGVITVDPGFKNTGSCESAITFLDGEKGVLRYRGYGIEELAENVDFLEVAYLLIFGELPTKEQNDKFHNDIKAESAVDEDVKKMLDAFPKSAHPMGIISSLTSALTADFWDIDRMATQIVSLLKNKKLRQKQIEAGYMNVENATWVKAANQIFNVYKKALGV